jgi:hypothetical protein
VYLIICESQWPVEAIAHDHPSALQSAAEKAQELRKKDTTTRVLRIPVRDAVEMEIVPKQIIQASLKERSE